MFNGYDLSIKLCPTKCTSHLLDHDVLNIQQKDEKCKLFAIDLRGKIISSIVNKVQQNMHIVTICPPTHLEYKHMEIYNL
jgi:hypothetical protein